MVDDDRVRTIVREELNGKVVYRDTCEKQHEGDGNTMKDMKDRIKTVESRLWAIIVLALGQMAGIIGILIKG